MKKLDKNEVIATIIFIILISALLIPLAVKSFSSKPTEYCIHTEDIRQELDPDELTLHDHIEHMGDVIEVQDGKDYCYECEAAFSMAEEEDPQYAPLYEDSKYTLYRELIDMDLPNGDHFYSDHLIIIDWKNECVLITEWEP